MEPYRGASGGSPTLAALAAEASTGVPRQSALLSADQIRERLELAADVRADGGSLGALVATTFAALVALMAWVLAVTIRTLDGAETAALVLVPAAIAITLGLVTRWSTTAAKARRDAAVATLRAWPATLPFPADGFDDYLVTDRPMLDIVVAVPAERRVFIAAIRTIDAAIEVEAIGERTFRLTLPARSRSPATDEAAAPPVRFGDRLLLASLFQRLILPLHAESGVEAVHFGGTIDARR